MLSQLFSFSSDFFTSFKDFLKSLLSSESVTWCKLTLHADLLVWCLPPWRFWTVSVIQYNCTMSLIARGFNAASSFHELKMLLSPESHRVWHPPTCSSFSPLLSALPLSKSSAVLELASPFPLVSSPRPFYFGCFCLLVFSFFGCLNSWSTPCIFDFSRSNDQCEVPVLPLSSTSSPPVLDSQAFSSCYFTMTLMAELLPSPLLFSSRVYILTLSQTPWIQFSWVTNPLHPQLGLSLPLTLLLLSLLQGL